jgi:hypothetical protein
MHRSLALALSILSSTFPVLLSAEEVTPEEQAFFDQRKCDMIQIETEKLDDLAIEAVFSRPFYSLKLTIAVSGDGGSSTYIVARVDDAIVPMLQPGQDGDLPDFQKLLNPEFKLRTNTDGKMMQQALNVLYPPFMESEKKLISFRHAGTTWTFVRGEFFESKSGYIFETDEGGAITSVKYLLRLP